MYLQISMNIYKLKEPDQISPNDLQIETSKLYTCPSCCGGSFSLFPSHNVLVADTLPVDGKDFKMAGRTRDVTRRGDGVARVRSNTELADWFTRPR